AMLCQVGEKTGSQASPEEIEALVNRDRLVWAEREYVKRSIRSVQEMHVNHSEEAVWVGHGVALLEQAVCSRRAAILVEHVTSDILDQEFAPKDVTSPPSPFKNQRKSSNATAPESLERLSVSDSATTVSNKTKPLTASKSLNYESVNIKV